MNSTGPRTVVLETIRDFERKANHVRNQVLDMCMCAETGHITSSFSCVELLVALYYGAILRYNPTDPEWCDRDRFILSKGQAAPLLYVVLADIGFYPVAELSGYCKCNGILGAHPQNDVPGVEVSTGSLGHGLGIGAGLALAAKRDRCAYRTFVLLSDGECHEGSTWESAMFAAHHRLNNLIAIVDRNKLCVTGFIKSIVRLDPFDEKWRSFGWGVVTIDGHSFKEIFRALKPVRRRNDTRPLVVIANTVKGKGVSFMENVPLWHGGVPKGRQVKLAKAELARKA